MIACLWTIQMPLIVTEFSLKLLDKSPDVRSWIHLEFPNISVRFSNMQLELRLNSSPREPSGGPGFDPQWRTIFAILWELQKQYSVNNFCYRKSCRYLIPTRMTSRSWGIRFCCQKHFFIFCSSGTVRTHTCVLFCFWAFPSGLSLALKLRWPKLGLQGKH